MLEPIDKPRARWLPAAIAVCAARAVPEVGKALENRPSELDLDLSQPLTIDQMEKATRQVENEISGWAEKANDRHQENSREIRDIVTGIATIADSFRRRDQGTGKELGDLTKRLRSVAELFDGRLNDKVGARRPFSMIMIDLNNFKRINDKFGHLLGDDVLRQFADELRKHFRQADILARWGGDEFAVILSSSGNDVRARVARFRRSALAEYKVKTPAGSVNIPLDASIGVVSWDGRESGSDLLARADREMYSGKGLPRT